MCRSVEAKAILTYGLVHTVVCFICNQNVTGQKEIAV